MENGPFVRRTGQRIGWCERERRRLTSVSRGRHLPALTHILRTEIDEERARSFFELGKPDDELRERMTGAREQTDVRPGIEVLFRGEELDLSGIDARLELSAIAVAIPTYPAEEVSVVRAQPNQVAAAPMIGTQDKPLLRQGAECRRDIGVLQARTIRPDNDNLLITEPPELLGRGLETRTESGAALLMKLKAGARAGPFRVREKVKISIDSRRFQPAQCEQRLQRTRETAPGKIESGRMGKDKNSATLHGNRIRFLRLIFPGGCRLARFFSDFVLSAVARASSLRGETRKQDARATIEQLRGGLATYGSGARA